MRLFKDPVTSFLTYNRVVAALFEDDDTPTEDDMLKDPTNFPMNSVALMLDKENNEDEGFSDTPHTTPHMSTDSKLSPRIFLGTSGTL